VECNERIAALNPAAIGQEQLLLAPLGRNSKDAGGILGEWLHTKETAQDPIDAIDEEATNCENRLG